MMTTIKDVAKMAGVSISTVSIVINGKAKERKVAKATCEKVLNAVKLLEYKPNLTARRLKSSEISKPTIAFYWPLDYRTSFLATILSGFQKEMKKLSFDCEIVISLYENNKLEREQGLLNNNYFDAAIIGATSKKDNEYLETIDSQMPIILFNRDLEGFSSVYCESEISTEKISKLFWAKGHERIAIFNSKLPYYAMSMRTKNFISSCEKYNIEIDENFILNTDNTYEGGAIAASRFLNLPNRPKALYCDSDIIALGATHTFNKNNIKIPEDIEIVAIGMSDTELTKYSTPPITVAAIPSEEMASYCINIVYGMFKNKISSPVKKVYELEMLLRDSCRP